jgi:proteasome lid subunit RPN8/RPN11
MGHFEVCSVIKLTALLFRQLTEYCTAQLPIEACGVLYGIINQNDIHITEFVPVANIAEQPKTHFEFERGHFTELLYKSLDPEIKWLGIFHSHPHTAPNPSKHDLRTLWDLPVYAIISLETPLMPIMKSYEIKAGKQKKPYSIKEQAIEFIEE